ncbi:Bromodomain Adjacent To Zinc Finger Domain Protein 2B [Manis pentadactyla]|nr:Bromodomain Adjacent To Zinc Finger Domain Protein 2B [Manis pentadactyla]
MACRAAAQGGFTMSRAAAGTAAGGASPTATPPPRARCSGQPTGPASSPRASRPPASTNLNEMETHLSKEQRKGTTEENDSGHLSEQPSCTSIKKPKQEESLYLTNCRMILTEIENHADAWPFHLPKLISGQYPNLEAFAVDVRLVFDNCEAFNQDDSDTGRAGHSIRKYFEKKWTDTLKVSRSYNNLFSPFQ